MEQQIDLQNIDLLDIEQYLAFKKWVKVSSLAEISDAFETNKGSISRRNKALIRVFAEKKIADESMFWKVIQIIVGVQTAMISLSMFLSSIVAKSISMGKWLVSGKDNFKMGPPQDQYGTLKITGKVSNNTFAFSVIVAILFTIIVTWIIDHPIKKNSIGRKIAQLELRRMKYELLLGYVQGE
ncbi:MAG: hypothetical protein ABF743_10175 [Schleiferilactobacillus perolens]|uniref:hypothetical protein n=1 Tax=Schleiferilactobacillus perolens TaxID=100468 RepID=UPI0039E85B27